MHFTWKQDNKTETIVNESILAFMNFIIELIVIHFSKLFLGGKPKSTNIWRNVFVSSAYHITFSNIFVTLIHIELIIKSSKVFKIINYFLAFQIVFKQEEKKINLVYFSIGIDKEK